MKLSLDVDEETSEAAVLGKLMPSLSYTHSCPAVLGKRAIQEITILNDDCERTSSLYRHSLCFYTVVIIACTSKPTVSTVTSLLDYCRSVY